jgi:hypothetical protein
MQDIMDRLGLPAQPEAVMDNNQAAIALAMAMSRARAEFGDREGVKAEAKGYAVAKLEALRRKLAPLYAAIPRDVELFDLGLVSHEKPRLYVDIVAFVEMNRDQTAYRFLQETRAGRATLAETGDDSAMIEHVTDYVARRLVERERALTAGPTLAAAASPAGNPAPVVSQPLLPQSPLSQPPKPSLPMTAEQAFQQWSRVSKAAEAEEKEEVAPDTATPVSAAVGQAAREVADAAAESLHAAVKPAQAAVAKAAGPAAAIAGASTVPVKEAAAAARRGPSTPAARPASSGGWWMWPFLALLIGIGLGALALYLYAASIAR